MGYPHLLKNDSSPRLHSNSKVCYCVAITLWTPIFHSFNPIEFSREKNLAILNYKLKLYFQIFSITCTISISGVDLTTNYRGNTGSCIIINLANFAITTLSIPEGSSSVTSEQQFRAGTYSVIATATIQGRRYNSENGPHTTIITDSDVTAPFTLI